MKRCLKIFILFLLFSSLLLTAGESCTTFCLDHGDQPVFGRNFDWIAKAGLMMINKRGVTKVVRSGPQDRLLTWTSKYGSATFNQYGREFPMGGMNEAGLVVESMVLEETEYPLPDSRPAINMLQWLQYHLDNFCTIEEVIASNSKIRISGLGGPGYHFLVCDRTGNCSIIEFIENELVYYTKERIPVKTLTNRTYTESISFWKKDKLPQPDKGKSVDRFLM